jgi:hypothetical protein
MGFRPHFAYYMEGVLEGIQYELWGSEFEFEFGYIVA